MNGKIKNKFEDVVYVVDDKRPDCKVTGILIPRSTFEDLLYLSAYKSHRAMQHIFEGRKVHETSSKKKSSS